MPLNKQKKKIMTDGLKILAEASILIMIGQLASVCIFLSYLHYN